MKRRSLRVREGLKEESEENRGGKIKLNKKTNLIPIVFRHGRVPVTKFK